MFAHQLRSLVWLRHHHQLRSRPLPLAGLCRFKTRFAYPEGMVAPEDDYTETPEYPEIDPETRFMGDVSKKARAKRLQWHETIQSKPTVEEKLLEMNVHHAFGWKSVIIDENEFAYNSLPLYKFITRTHAVQGNQLPEVYSSPELNEKVKYFADKVREPLLNALQFERNEVKRREYSDLAVTAIESDLAVSKSVVNQVNRILVNVLAKEVDYFRTCQIDHTPKVEAFWLAGNMQRNRRELNRILGFQKVNNPHFREIANKQFGEKFTERNLQYYGSPLLQVRCSDPIQNFVSGSSTLCNREEGTLNNAPYDTIMEGLRPSYKFGSIIPGHWPNDTLNCAQVVFHPRHHLLQSYRANNPYYDDEENENSLLSQAMLVGFGRLVSQALYFGFDQFSDVTYPFSTQVILTNGDDWSFFAYQLNTLRLDKMSVTKHNKQNICWGTKTMKIFQDESRTKLNDEVLHMLLKFYLNPPTPIELPNEQKTPYLKCSLADIEDEVWKAKVHFNLTNMLARKHEFPSMVAFRMPEIYLWEYIYKINNQMRPLDARRRHFELPHGFPKSDPYNEPYKLTNPLFVRKGLKWLMVLRERELEREKLRLDKKKVKSDAAELFQQRVQERQ